MYMTALRPVKPGDQAKAAAIVSAAKQAMTPYQDYHKALDDGYEIFFAQRAAIPHITSRRLPMPSRPARASIRSSRRRCSIRRRLTAMHWSGRWVYRSRPDASEEEIDSCIPLSIARWHQHVNFCKGTGRAQGGVLRPWREVRPAGLDQHRRGVHSGRQEILSACVFGWMVHGLSLRERSDGHLVDYVDGRTRVTTVMDHGLSMPGMKVSVVLVQSEASRLREAGIGSAR